MADISVLLELSLSEMGKDILSDASTQRKKTEAELRQIRFGQLAFIKETAWRRNNKHRASKKKRRSHPGLCVATNTSRMSFGSSKTDGRDRNNPYLFFVSGSESEIISSRTTTVFLLFLTVPINWYDIDLSKSTIGTLTSKSMKRLRKRIKKHYPHYLNEYLKEVD